jgi:hypothetical protein
MSSTPLIFLSENRGVIQRVCRMRGIIRVASVWLLISVAMFAEAEITISAETADEPRDAAESTNGDEEFQPLDEPERSIGGAYWGIGAGVMRVSLDVEASRRDGQRVNVSDASMRPEISALGGFGAAFYKSYYAGIGIEIFKRFAGKTVTHSSGEVSVIHRGTVGLNMDVKFGRLYPKHGLLVYGSVGFARLQGYMMTADIRQKGSYGSFVPVFGMGAQRKLNDNWAGQLAVKYTIPTKDDNKKMGSWTHDGTVQGIVVAVGAVRDIK